MKKFDDLKNEHRFQVDIVKRAFRLIACGTLVLAGADGVGAAGLMFAVGEVLGILEDFLE